MNQPLKGYRKSSLIQVLDSCIASPKIFHLITVSVLLVAVYYFIKLPILSFGDTDLWYHLNGGRYFFQNKEIPQSGFFSFIAGSREWSNYYWLFQALVYQIYTVSDYYGLIFFKAISYFITVLIISHMLLKGEKHDKQVLYFMALSILFCFGLIPRYFALLRPHILSYLFIPLSLYLLESRSKALIALPLLAILWSNFHGIEYPIFILMSISYLFEFFVGRLRNKTPLKREDLFYVIPIVLSMWSILLNPYGFALLETPFNLAEYQDQYIKELSHIKIGDLFTIKLYPFVDLMNTVFNALLIAAWIGCIKAVWVKKIRISHLMLLAGGLVLLVQAERFRYEAVLLALPVLKSHPLFSRANSIRGISKSLRVFIALILLSVSIFILHTLFKPEGKYPFSHSHLPRGVATFLNHIGRSGSILNNPEHGGYLQWVLNPRYKIFMDLQMVLFTDKDFFLVTNALNQKDVLKKLLDKYNPAFIIEKVINKKFRELIKDFPEYRAVFFDNTSVLYVNNKVYPKIAEQYELTKIDPYTIMHVNMDNLSEERANDLLKELLLLYGIYPEGALLNLKIGEIYKRKGDIDKALIHALAVIRNYPEFPAGYILKGDLLLKRKLFSEAISSYKNALDHPTQGIKSTLYKKLAISYSKIGQHNKAYNHMKKGVNIFSPDTGYRDLHRLGNMALMIGKIKEGAMLLRFAYYRTPHEETKFIEKIRKQLDGLRPYLNSRDNKLLKW